MSENKESINELYHQAAQMLEYCPNTGNLYWKKVNPHYKVKIEDVAGCIAKSAGKGKTPRYYIRVVYKKTPLLGHRLCWLIHYGYLTEMIDHVDGSPVNNKLVNLRSCTNQENGFNRGKNKNNSSGYKGVSYNKDRKKFQAKIHINGKGISLGYFNDAKDAHNAYIEASKKHHGVFFRSSI